MPPPKGRTLVVDDDDDIREALRDALEGEGYEIDTARDGYTALAHLRSHPLPPLILLDWNMAPMNGTQFMDEMAKDSRLATVPVVLLTADVRAPDEAAGHGFVGCLRKPVKLDVLFEMLSRYCG